MAAAIDLYSYQEPILFLATAGIVVPLFHRLRISPVLGFLGAGALLGPYGLGRLTTELSVGELADLHQSGGNLAPRRVRRGLPAVHDRHRAVLAAPAHAAAAGLRVRLAAGASVQPGSRRSRLQPRRHDHGSGHRRAGLRIVVDCHRDPGDGRAEAPEDADRPGDLLGAYLPGPRAWRRSSSRSRCSILASPKSRPRRSSGRCCRPPSRLRFWSASVASSCGLSSNWPPPPKSPEVFMAACLLVVIVTSLIAAVSGLSMALGRVHRRHPVVGDRISPRRRRDDPALQGPAARRVLRVGRHESRPVPPARCAGAHPVARRLPSSS